MTYHTTFHQDPDKINGCMKIYAQAVQSINEMTKHSGDLEKIYHLLSLAHSFSYRGLRLLAEIHGYSAMQDTFKDLVAAIDKDLNKVRHKNDT